MMNCRPDSLPINQSGKDVSKLAPAPAMHWRTHPKLKGRFHPKHPDDLQVIVHDGGPRMTDSRPEAVWVTVTECDGDVFTGRVLNEPIHLRTVQEGQQIRFIVPASSEHPLLVTDKYLRERPLWTIHPCKKCGFSELFDAPSDLIRIMFPDIPAGAVMEAFSILCPWCGGVQVLEFRQAADQTVRTPEGKRAWWQIWNS